MHICSVIPHLISACHVVCYFTQLDNLNIWRERSKRMLLSCPIFFVTRIISKQSGYLRLIFRRASVSFLLSFEDGDGVEHSCLQSDMYHYKMSTYIRWYDIHFTRMHTLRKLRLYAATPLFYDEKGKAIPNR